MQVPLPDIPYNKDAASKLFGDVPEMMAYVKRTQRIFVFIKPMSLPWVVITDPFESQDILLRRTKEFDRASFFGEVLGGLLPHQHIQFQSTDARFKDNRNLTNHLMAPSFINEVSAPEVYSSVCTLMKLWQVKCDTAQGRPFSAHHDITYAALDSIFASSFGLAEADSITVQRLDAVSRWVPELPPDIDTPVAFPDSAIPEIFAAVLTLADSVKAGQLSPSPRLTSWVLRKLPHMRRATATKDAFMAAQIAASLRLIETSPTARPRSALHSVLLRSRALAAKHADPPPAAPRLAAISDEFTGFTMAGHDTTATAVAWGVKLLADHAAAQDRLRAALRAALPAAVRERRAPTLAELVEARVPYLDAVVDEVLRLANAIAFVVRVALVDAVVLGRRIPKGTDVFLMANGAGYLEPGVAVDDAVRSPGARRREGKAYLSGAWDDADVAAFKPERWLRVEPGSGREVYDPLAGPSLAFGLGPRGCFGRRLAVVTLRIQFAMTVWRFKLLGCPEELSGYDAVQKFAREPTKCYVRLAAAGI
ncbi:hypothetical protein SLS56_010831 [Neofusicoccum ribis]|uniref:Cytochrome P450 n=1 Tax=Neofusicoccum ribis TaxID=45134 RepID=A0ABR3SEW1_9PEZI